MMDFEVVPSAIKRPWHCVCGSQKGPLIDTFYQTNDDIIYICKQCARRAARKFGFAPGERYDELMNALELMEAKEAVITRLQEEVVERQLALNKETSRADVLQEQLNEALEREQTRVHVEQQIKDLAGSVT